MKTILFFLFLIIPFASFAQTRIVQNDTIVKVSADSIVTQIVRVDTLKFNDGTKMSTAGGSTITASDGVYMDGDTVKLGGELTQDVSIHGNNSLSILTLGGIFANLQDGTKYSTLNVYNPNDTARIDLSVSDGVNTSSIALTTDGLAIDFDTTLTTPNHLMTEQQVKREIAAADDWKATSAGIRYEGDTGDSVAIARDGTIKIYKSGNLKTSINPNVTNSPTAISFLHSANNSLSSTAKVFEFNQQGANKFYQGSSGKVYNENGGFQAGLGSVDYSDHTASYYRIVCGSTVRLLLDPTVADGATSAPFSFQTKNKPIGNLFEYGIQGRNKVYADTSGIITYKGTYASIFRHKSLGDTTQSIPTGTTPTKVLAFSTNGEQSNCTADKTNDKITITKPGRYMVNLSLSYASGTNAVNWTAYIFNGGVECENIHSTGYTATANDKRSTSLSGIINVTSVPCDIDYRVTHSAGASVDLIMTYVNLNVNYIGD